MCDSAGCCHGSTGIGVDIGAATGAKIAALILAGTAAVVVVVAVIRAVSGAVSAALPYAVTAMILSPFAVAAVGWWAVRAHRHGGLWKPAAAEKPAGPRLRALPAPPQRAIEARKPIPWTIVSDRAEARR